jgi:YHS domain-containing protein
MDSMEESTNVKLRMVCGRSIETDPAYIPQAPFHGRAVYFCTEFCLHAFQQDPDRFVQVHHQAHIQPKVCEFDLDK